MKISCAKYFTISILLLFGNTKIFSQNIHLFYNSTPEIEFAVNDLENSLGAANLLKSNEGDYRNNKSEIKILLSYYNDSLVVKNISGDNQEKIENLSPEGFSIIIPSKKNDETIYVVGFDEPGLMYGTLELAEKIRFNGLENVRETKQNPYMKERGIKFNIPLDLRTPSYTDASDVAQNNIENVWDFNFWKEYIDDLAKDRYNLISLWNLHPFPSMVRVPDYPDVALNDVQRTSVKWPEYNSLSGDDFTSPEKLKNPEIIKKMTIDEKIAFWRKVMKYGKERNVRFFIITWNVFVNGAQGKYGITDDYKNQTTIDYFRKSVKQMILTYPDLAGIGLTTGENFYKATDKEKEDWAFNTYGLGVMDALKEQPDRKITFIHRQHQTGALEVIDKFTPLIENKNINFIFSFKYAQAHVMSSVIQPYCENFVKEIKSQGNLKTMWTLRNDDNYYFRWGAPDFVREFIKNIPYDVSEGIYYGSDQWIWGRDFLSKDPQFLGQLEIEKHWYHWMMWGRLGYNPDLKDDFFKKMLSVKFPGADPDKLFTSWQCASMIYPLTTGFHWGDLDFRWYIEACKGHPQKGENKFGFHDVNKFISLPPHPGTNYQSIPDYVKMIKAGSKTSKITPAQVSQMIHHNADKALELVNEIPAGKNKELFYTLNDIKTMAYLGKYYAYKIKGAVELQKYKVINTDKKSDREAAVQELILAGKYWKMYMELAKKSYKNPIWTNRVGIVDWEKIYRWVLDDITIAKETKK